MKAIYSVGNRELPLPTQAFVRSFRMEVGMTRLREKAQARTKQVVGQMIGDDKLVEEGKEEQQRAEGEKTGDRRSRDQRQE